MIVLIVIQVKAGLIMHNYDVLELFCIFHLELLKCGKFCKVFFSALLDVFTLMPVPIDTFVMTFTAISQLPKPSLAVLDRHGLLLEGKRWQ
jgi:hypothetical protein